MFTTSATDFSTGKMDTYYFVGKGYVHDHSWGLVCGQAMSIGKEVVCGVWSSKHSMAIRAFLA